MQTERFFADLHAASTRLAGDGPGYDGAGVRSSARKASALG
jgi:hypothetical protein